jgi:hypothetical protein
MLPRPGAQNSSKNAGLFVRALRMSGMENEVVVVRDGVEALDFLFGRSDYAARDTAIMPRSRPRFWPRRETYLPPRGQLLRGQGGGEVP